MRKTPPGCGYLPAMGKRREPSAEELLAEQRAAIAEAIEQGKTELDLRTESIEIVREACAITTLKKLTLRLGTLAALPAEIGQLVGLESLHIDNNELTSLPEEIGALVNVHTFYAYHNKLTALPESFGEMRSLRKLVIWKNELTTLPRSFGKLTKLVDLELKWNELTALPDEFAGLASLEELTLASNKLTTLPADLSGLVKLRRLCLETNKLATFPAGLLTLPALVELELKNNGLRALPDDIDRIATLRELDVEDNELERLPARLWSLPLASLKAAENKLTAVPEALARMPSLFELELHDNPIEDLPDGLLRRSKSELLAHFGWWQPKPNRIPAPDDRAAIVKRYKTQLENFTRAAKKAYRFDRDRLPVILAFITGETDVVPAGHFEDSERIGELVEVLAPYRDWSFVDRRILAFITQESWRYKNPGYDYFRGYDEAVYRWLAEQMKSEEPGSTLAADVFGELVAEGVPELELVLGALRHLSDELMRDGTPTSFGRFLLGWAPGHEDVLLAQDRSSVREALIGLLIRHGRELFVRVGDRLLTIEPDEDGEIHLPYDALEHACAVDPARFEGLLLEGIERTDCDPCRAEATRVLANCYPPHRARALELTRQTLRTISDRKNKEERFNFAWSGGERWGDGTPQYIGWALDTFGAAVHADVHHLVEHTKVFDIDVAEVVAAKLGQSAIDMLGEGLQMTYDDDSIAPHFRRMFGLLAPLDWSKYHEHAWKIARSEHRKVRETACLALGRLPAAEVLQPALDLLASKKGHEREAGVLVLSLLDDDRARTTLRGLLATETSDDARDLIVTSIYRDDTKCDRAEAERRVASARVRGKLAKPVAKWIDEKKLPKLMWGKTALSPDAVRFLLYRQTRQAEIAIDPEARAPLALIDRAKSGPFASKLLALVLKNGGASAKTRFALALIGALGDDDVIAPLEKLAIDGRNENAVRTLGLLGTTEAARALDRILKAFRVKYPNVREAAQEAFDSIADRLGVTPFELADTMIPDFGFAKGRLAVAGTKPPLFVVIGGDQKLAYVDAKGAPVKPPKSLAAKPKAALKALAEEIRQAAKQLAGNLEYYLIVRRRWKPAAFTAFFEGNPLARSFALGFVWGAYRGARLVQAFRLGDELRDVAGTPVALGKDKDLEIGMVHPLELSEADRGAWRAAMADATPAFAQLDRPTFAVGEGERARAKCFRFEDRELPSQTFKGRAERRGWRRGSVVDGGEVSSYRKVFPHDQVEAFIKTGGLAVQSYGEDGEVTLKELFFVRPGSVVIGSYTYDEPRDEKDDRLIPLDGVPSIVFSEAIADLTAITKQRDAAEA